MASPSASGSSKANAAPPAAEVPSPPSKRRRVSSPQIKDEEHTEPSLADAVFSSAEDAIKAAIMSAYDKVHTNAIKNLKRDLQQKDVKLHQKDVELHQIDVRLCQKDVMLQQKDAELHQKHIELQQKEAELHRKDVKLQQKEAELRQKHIELQQKDIPAAKGTAAVKGTPAAGETSTKKTLLKFKLRACEISIQGGAGRLYAALNLQEMLERLGAEKFTRHVTSYPSGPAASCIYIPTVYHVVTSQEACNQGCQEVTIPGRYHGIRVRTVLWEWVKRCFVRWEKKLGDGCYFPEPEEAKRVTEEEWNQVQEAPLSLHFQAICQNGYPVYTYISD